jgi:hypothetical protein
VSLSSVINKGQFSNNYYTHAILKRHKQTKPAIYSPVPVCEKLNVKKFNKNCFATSYAAFSATKLDFRFTFVKI